MTCNLSSTILHGYLDGEIDAARCAEFEAHLASCPQCVAELEAQEVMRSAIQKAQLYEKAPANFRSKVRTAVHAGRRPHKFFLLRPSFWIPVAACLLLVVLYPGWQIFHGPVSHTSEIALANQLVDDHIRSLQPGHLSDVVSSDQHTVKPWFDGKLDFSPPVHDFSQQDFPLMGGRLEVVNGRSVAALIYGRRKHIISVFVWPRTVIDSRPQSGSQQGYNWVRWNKEGFEFWAISDCAVTDLEALRGLF